MAIIKRILSIPQWLSLPPEVKFKFIEAFKIPRSAFTHVQDNVVLSDGHTNADLAVVTVEALQGYLGSESLDFNALLDETIEYMLEEDVMKTAPPVTATEVFIAAQTPIIKEEVIKTDGKTTKPKGTKSKQNKGTDSNGTSAASGDNTKTGQSKEPVIPVAPKVG